MSPAGKHRPPIREEQQNHQRAPEVRERIEEEQHAELTRSNQLPASRRLQHADDDAEHEAQHERDAGEQQRARDRLRERVGDGLVLRERVPELSVRDARDVADELLGERSVVAELLAPVVADCRRDRRPTRTRTDRRARDE